MNRNKLNLMCYIEWNISESDNAIMNLYPTEVKVIDWNLSEFNVWLKGIPLSSLILNWTWGCIESSHWVQSYEISLEISFCPWLLYFEMIGQQEAENLRIEKGWISASCDYRNFDKSYFKNITIRQELSFYSLCSILTCFSVNLPLVLILLIGT